MQRQQIAVSVYRRGIATCVEFQEEFAKKKTVVEKEDDGTVELASDPAHWSV